ncbi:MFS transporter [Streptomyces sp. NPDC000594]|uniref:MFS transporter n=1 Tax=Streptomyces sp. NPDC000594 TaxID=3154261 RepID=UPI00332AB514
MTASAGALGRPFWIFWTSTSAANLADGIRAGAFPLIAAALTRDPFGVALVAACQQGAWLFFGLAAGLLADRRSPARVVAVADAVRVTTLAGLLTVLLLEAATIPVLAGAAFALGAAETFRDTSAQSVLPRLVTEGQLERANGRLFGTEIVGNEFLGPLLGAALIGVALTVPVAVDAAVLLVALLLVSALPRTPATRAPADGVQGTEGFTGADETDGAKGAAKGTGGTGRDGGGRDRAGESPALTAELLRGARWLLRHPRQRAITCAGAVICCADAAWWSVLVLYSDRALGVPVAAFGLLLAAGAVGGTVGALTAGRLAGRFTPRALLSTAAGATGLPAVVIALDDSPWTAGAMLAVSSAGFALWNVVALSARQRETPRHLLGRVTAVHRIALYGSGTAGALLGGWAAGALALTVPFHAAGPSAVLAAVGLLIALDRRTG